MTTHSPKSGRRQKCFSNFSSIVHIPLRAVCCQSEEVNVSNCSQCTRESEILHVTEGWRRGDESRKVYVVGHERL